MNGHFVAHRFEPEFVGCAVGDAAFDAAAGKPGGEGIGVVVATWLCSNLGNWQATEFTAADNQCLIEHATLLEVCEQRCNRLIDLGRKAAMVARDIDMPIPALLILRAAAVELDKTDATLDHPPGIKALPGKVLAALIIESVELTDGLGLAVQVEYFRRCRLHPVGEFKTGYARLEVRRCGTGLLMLFVERADKVELTSLLLPGHHRVANEIVDLRAAGIQSRALERSRQEARAPILGLAFR